MLTGPRGPTNCPLPTILRLCGRPPKLRTCMTLACPHRPARHPRATDTGQWWQALPSHAAAPYGHARRSVARLLRSDERLIGVDPLLHCVLAGPQDALKGGRVQAHHLERRGCNHGQRPRFVDYERALAEVVTLAEHGHLTDRAVFRREMQTFGLALLDDEEHISHVPLAEDGFALRVLLGEQRVCEARDIRFAQIVEDGHAGEPGVGGECTASALRDEHVGEGGSVQRPEGALRPCDHSGRARAVIHQRKLSKGSFPAVGEDDRTVLDGIEGALRDHVKVVALLALAHHLLVRRHLAFQHALDDVEQLLVGEAFKEKVVLDGTADGRNRLFRLGVTRGAEGP
mmetsp:Transcript_823/g.2313  ORF Transcript_823/g.2313 Transcript_823/m.2313 type:complete len:343 (+) Transcript_823:169-1197(+)